MRTSTPTWIPRTISTSSLILESKCPPIRSSLPGSNPQRVLLRTQESSGTFYERCSFAGVLTVKRSTLFVPLGTIFLFTLRNTVPPIVTIRVGRTMALTRLGKAAKCRVSSTPRHVAGRIGTVLCSDVLRATSVVPGMIGTMQIIGTSIHFGFVGYAGTVFDGRRQLVVTIMRLIRHGTRARDVLLPTPFAKFRVEVFTNGSRVTIYLFPYNVHNESLDRMMKAKGGVGHMFTRRLFVTQLRLGLSIFPFGVIRGMFQVVTTHRCVHRVPINVLFIVGLLRRIFQTADDKVMTRTNGRTASFAAQGRFVHRFCHRYVYRGLVVRHLLCDLIVILFTVFSRSTTVVQIRPSYVSLIG